MITVDPNDLQTLLNTHNNSEVAWSVSHPAACLNQYALVPFSDGPQTDDSDTGTPIILQIQQQH